MENNIIQRIAGRAVIFYEGKMLIIRESGKYEDGTNAGRYDFPGGKVEPGETLPAALKREVKEECGLEITIGEPIFVGEWRPIVKGKQLQIFGIYFRCETDKPEVILGQDHDDYQWIKPEDSGKWNFIPPNGEIFKFI